MRTGDWFISVDRKQTIIRSSSYKVTLKQTVSSIRSSVGQTRPDWRLEEGANELIRAEMFVYSRIAGVVTTVTSWQGRAWLA